MSGPFPINETSPDDVAEIDQLLDQCFGIARRVKTSYRLREGSQPIDGLSLTIREPGNGIVGAISFWPLSIGDEGKPALLLGPLAVHPQRQNLGIGLSLMREGLSRAQGLGHRLVILVGDEPYYSRVGFAKLPRDLLILPGPVNSERFLYLELVKGALVEFSGLVLPPYRYQQRLAAFTVPHGADGEEQCAEAQQ